MNSRLFPLGPTAVASPPLAIKGRLPVLRHQTFMREIYGSTPSLGGDALLVELESMLGRVDALLAGTPRLSEARRSTIQDLLVASLNDPTLRPVDRPLESLGPFPLAMASDAKLGNSFAWVDSNLKLGVEDIAHTLALSDSIQVRIAEIALRVYALLLKGNSYRLAKVLTFNVSMLLQERILAALFGPLYQVLPDARVSRSTHAVRQMMHLLEADAPTSVADLFTFSVFTGIVWPRLNRAGSMAEESAPRGLRDAIEASISWGINETQLAADVLLNCNTRAIVFLDDDAESIVDLLLIQRILAMNSQLHVTIVINSIPLSNNLAAPALELAMDHRILAPLREEFAGRAEVLLERQWFPSIEVQWLSSRSRAALGASEVAYLKGINYFETFRWFRAMRIHSFVVGSQTSELLTGLRQGLGVVRVLSPEQAPFLYMGSDHVVTLLSGWETA